MQDVSYGKREDLTPAELAAFYQRLEHPIHAEPNKIQSMMDNSLVFITARISGDLVGIARGVTDGIRGYLTECKLDPRYQGPAAVTRTDGRIEHDEHGIAAEMARRVLESMTHAGVERVDVLAWGTEVDFLEEIGFRRQGGLVGMTMREEDFPAATSTPDAAAGEA